MLPAYSPAVERAKPTGVNPMIVTNVPESILDVHRLVHNLREPHTRGQCACDLFLLRIQCSAQIQSVPTVLHHDAEYEGRFAIVPDQEGRRVFITTLDLGDVPKSERTT